MENQKEMKKVGRGVMAAENDPINDKAFGNSNTWVKSEVTQRSHPSEFTYTHSRKQLKRTRHHPHAAVSFASV